MGGPEVGEGGGTVEAVGGRSAPFRTKVGELRKAPSLLGDEAAPAVDRFLLVVLAGHIVLAAHKGATVVDRALASTDVATRFVIIGGGPAGNMAASYAARYGAEVTLIEREIIGGAAHLLDCIPSKAMIATGGAMSFTRRIAGMGLEEQSVEVDIEALTSRIGGITQHLQANTTQLLESQGVRLIKGSARLTGPHDIEVTSSKGVEHLTADAILSSTEPLGFPRSVVEMMQGLLGEPEGGWPEPFRENGPLENALRDK